MNPTHVFQARLGGDSDQAEHRPQAMDVPVFEQRLRSSPRKYSPTIKALKDNRDPYQHQSDDDGQMVVSSEVNTTRCLRLSDATVT
ncbi:hypothetical protein RRG08_013849 [Elysia crispata]|uniref:Uncharacterized protein n=1 Tax=Elysia crispata TaxID=231223 RepID=A0AAE1DKU7_9GAST|nr:hypothetical protein RRG08_013849 [Elysia crispata]